MNILKEEIKIYSGIICETSPEAAANKIYQSFILNKGNNKNIEVIGNYLKREYQDFNGFRDTNQEIISKELFKKRFITKLNELFKSESDKLNELNNQIFGNIGNGCLSWLWKINIIF